MGTPSVWLWGWPAGCLPGRKEASSWVNACPSSRVPPGIPSWPSWPRGEWHGEVEPWRRPRCYTSGAASIQKGHLQSDAEAHWLHRGRTQPTFQQCTFPRPITLQPVPWYDGMVGRRKQKQGGIWLGAPVALNKHKEEALRMHAGEYLNQCTYHCGTMLAHPLPMPQPMPLSRFEAAGPHHPAHPSTHPSPPPHPLPYAPSHPTPPPHPPIAPTDPHPPLDSGTGQGALPGGWAWCAEWAMCNTPG